MLVYFNICTRSEFSYAKFNPSTDTIDSDDLSNIDMHRASEVLLLPVSLPCTPYLDFICEVWAYSAASSTESGKELSQIDVQFVSSPRVDKQGYLPN